MLSRFSRAQRQRIVFLLMGNLLLLGAIWLLLKEGGSFGEVLRRAGPEVAPVALAGVGMTGIIFAGAIDLSVASIMVVAATVFGMTAYHGFSPMVCYGACVATAWGLSMVNGYLVRGLKIPAIIVTLAGLPFYRGVALIIADLGIPDFSGHITVHDEAYHAPGNQYAGWILLVVLLGALIWEQYGQTPRRMLGMGSSEEACRLMGLSPGRIRQSAFCAGGLFLGVASLIEVTRLQAIEPARMVLGLELQVIGTVILGGTNIFGGEGSFLGTILGAFFLYFISQVLTYAEAGAYFEEAITGFIIIAVIGLDCVLHRRRKLLEELA